MVNQNINNAKNIYIYLEVRRNRITTKVIFSWKEEKYKCK